ncbi:hypothetical protein HDU93_001335 [Gonapodya sp. JEL0774]|nr:hypothetical protein HDU93_001335 [Gonapodya sp. JEL0774]
MQGQTVSYVMLPSGTTVTHVSVPANVSPSMQELVDSGVISMGQHSSVAAFAQNGAGTVTVNLEDEGNTFSQPPTSLSAVGQDSQPGSLTNGESISSLPPLPPHMSVIVDPKIPDATVSERDSAFAHAIKRTQLRRSETGDCVDVNLIFNAPPPSDHQETVDPRAIESLADSVSIFATPNDLPAAEVVLVGGGAEELSGTLKTTEDGDEMTNSFPRATVGAKTVGPPRVPLAVEHEQNHLEVRAEHPETVPGRLKRRRVSDIETPSVGTKRKTRPRASALYTSSDNLSAATSPDLGFGEAAEAEMPGIDSDGSDAPSNSSDDTDYASGRETRKRSSKSQTKRSTSVAKSFRTAQIAKAADISEHQVDSLSTMHEVSTDSARPSRLRARRSSGSRKVKAAVSRFDVKTIVVKASDAPEGSDILPDGVTAVVYPCSVCDKIWPKLYNLKSHLKTHISERPFHCNHCTATFVRGHDLKRHTRLHTGEQPFSCEKCRKRFTRSDALRRHNLVEQCDLARSESDLDLD